MEPLVLLGYAPIDGSYLQLVCMVQASSWSISSSSSSSSSSPIKASFPLLIHVLNPRTSIIQPYTDWAITAPL